MNDKIGNLVRFEIDRLFNGAVDVDWLQKDVDKAARAATAFVFHGPGTHGVAASVAEGTGHRLVDTATFTADVAANLASPGTRSFTLAIASYGSGKSHLAVTLSELFSDPDGKTAKEIVGNITKADASLARRIGDSVREIGAPVLVLTVNGMNDADLASVLLSQLKERISADGHSIEPLESLRQRFKIAANMLGNINAELAAKFVKSSGSSSLDECRARLLAFDESLYEQAQFFFRTIGQPIKTIGDETVKDVLGKVASEYIGPGKPYARLLILFDEFGHYLEFAANKPQVAGDGALQHLFEGVQTHSNSVVFVGFIQFELKAYLQRFGSMIRKEANRYVTRYDAADKYYLSSNLETLVASLLVKTKPPKLQPEGIAASRERLLGWYESAKNNSSWSDADAFARIATGCWPLSPVAMWVIYYLSSSGRFLQQRSALSLLKAALAAHKNDVLDNSRPALPPVALWTKELHDEFLEMESAVGATSTIVQSFDAVYERNEQHLSEEEIAVLRAIVLIEQTKLRATDREDMVSAIAVFSGLEHDDASDCLNDLENEKNVIAWEESFRRFEIFASAGSKAQFRLFLRKKEEEYDEERRAKLFLQKAEPKEEWPGIPLINQSLSCSFGDEHRIKTHEWDFEPRFSTWDLFRLSVPNLAHELRERSRFQSVSEKEKRGFVVYCFVPDNEDEATVRNEAQRMLRAQCSKLPFMLVLLFDKGHRISDPLVQLDLLDSLGPREKEQFDRLVPAQQRGQEELLEQAVRAAISEGNILAGVALDKAPRLRRAFGDAVFEKLFPKIIPFPFDGFTTKGGVSRASTDCAEITRSLFLSSVFSYDDTQSMGTEKRNRAQTVLKDAWSVFSEQDGAVSVRRATASVKSLMEEWNKALFSDEGLSAPAALERACAAPYGANVYSAGLLLSVFFRAHRNAKDIQVLKAGVAVEIEALSSVIPGNTALNPKAKDFEDIRFVKAVSDEDSPWKAIVDDWPDCISYREKIAFKDRIDALQPFKDRVDALHQTLMSIPLQFRSKVEDIICGIDEAKRQMDAADEKVSDHMKRIMEATRKGDTFQLAFRASLLADALRTRSTQSYLWDKELDIAPLEKELRESRQRIVSWFPSWLQSFNPEGDTADAIAAYRQNANERMGRNLRNLDLFNEEEQLRRKVARVLHHLEAIADARTRKREAEAWAESHSTIPPNLTCAELNKWKAECDQYRDVLQRSASSMRTVDPGIADEISGAQKSLNEIKNALSNARQALDGRARKIFGMELSKETARSVLDEIDAIVRLYEGSPKNQEDFRDARIEVNDYIILAGQLSNIETSEDVFQERVEKAKTDFVEKFTEIEPPWDPQEVFDDLVGDCEKSRAQASKTWVARMLEKYADPSALSVQETIAAIDELARRIPCFNPKDAPKLAPVEKALAKHKDNLGVDLLVAQFNVLSPTAKKQFLLRIKISEKE